MFYHDECFIIKHQNISVIQPKVISSGEFSMTDPVVAQKSPYKVEVKEGEKYAWCTCGLSTNQPFCNGAHKQTDDLKPLVFLADKDATMFLCGCKQTGAGPACDGAHKSL